MKYTILLLTIFTSIIFYAAVKYPTGIVGLTKLNGEGCICHTLETDPTVFVWVNGPDTVQVGQTASYKIFLTGGPKVKGGYNVAARFGTLAVIDTFSRIIDLELTHAFPKSFNSHDTISWEFEYTAPSTIGSDTIYSVAMSVNGDEIPTDEDKWNFGNNFLLTLVPPVKVEDETDLASMGFELMQNYPNPFNPSTKIGYTIPALTPFLSHLWQGSSEGAGQRERVSEGQVRVSLKVYDILGNEVATLVNEYKTAGSYEVEFSAKGGYTSGVYYYRLEVGSYSQTKKMVLER